MTLLKLHAIEKRFGPTIALDGVDLEVAAGEVHAVIGENGAGKSTLMNILSGAFASDRGEMSLDGIPYAPIDPAEARRAGIAHIHQELALCPHLSVAENMLLGTEPSAFGWLDRQTMFERAAALLREFGRAEIDPHVRTSNLSLADQQVVEICRALARDARVMLMDEPTSSLQRSNVERLFRMIQKLRDRGIAIIYISHFLEEVREIAERFTVLRDGKSVATGALSGVTDAELISFMVGGRPSPAASPRPLPRGEGSVVLEVENLAAPPRVHSASFVLRRGEILGIAGLIGSGRTELIRALFGLQRATATRIRLHGSFGYLSEDRKREGLALALSIADNITMSRLSTCARAGWLNLRQQAAQARDAMQRLRVKAAGPEIKVARLSGGNQQKVALGRLLHQDPDILLLDEPARGIDIATRQDVFAEIAQLAASGKAILMVSSYLPELLGVCDRIAVMSRGRLSPARPISEWTADSIMEVAIGGSA
ncbi:MAG TPA: sugar ABC transporter ATP-binding protein [Thermoanaerobaculia bacterium]|nr:sugar ABC transporter ATP-binding protein [Thermoanaerobaculia bacterium]